MTKIDVLQPICAWDGEQLISPLVNCSECGQIIESVGITLRSVCLIALSHTKTNSRNQPDNESVEEKFLRFELGMRIQTEDNPDLKAKEISMLQDLIQERYTSPLVVVQAHIMLEPKSIAKDDG